MKNTLLWRLLTTKPLAAWHYALGRARLYWLLFRHHATPRHVKTLLILALAYLLFPLDIIPDTIPIIGVMDDMALLWLALNYAERFASAELRARAGVGGME